jgi:hypothetical protein
VVSYLASHPGLLRRFANVQVLIVLHVEDSHITHLTQMPPNVTDIVLPSRNAVGPHRIDTERGERRNAHRLKTPAGGSLLQRPAKSETAAAGPSNTQMVRYEAGPTPSRPGVQKVHTKGPGNQKPAGPLASSLSRSRNNTLHVEPASPSLAAHVKVVEAKRLNGPQVLSHSSTSPSYSSPDPDSNKGLPSHTVPSIPDWQVLGRRAEAAPASGRMPPYIPSKGSNRPEPFVGFSVGIETEVILEPRAKMRRLLDMSEFLSIVAGLHDSTLDSRHPRMDARNDWYPNSIWDPTDDEFERWAVVEEPTILWVEDNPGRCKFFTPLKCTRIFDEL